VTGGELEDRLLARCCIQGTAGGGQGGRAAIAKPVTSRKEETHCRPMSLPRAAVDMGERGELVVYMVGSMHEGRGLRAAERLSGCGCGHFGWGARDWAFLLVVAGVVVSETLVRDV